MRESLEQGLSTQRARAVSVFELHRVAFHDGSRLSVNRVRVVLDDGESLGVFFISDRKFNRPFRSRWTAAPPALAARCCASRVEGAVSGEAGIGSGSLPPWQAFERENGLDLPVPSTIGEALYGKRGHTHYPRLQSALVRAKKAAR